MTDPDDLLAAYVDGELDPETARAVEHRIAADPKARRLVELHRETTALLRSACAETVYAAGATGLVPLPRAPFRVSRRAIGWAVAASFAGAVFGVGGGMLLDKHLTDDTRQSDLLADIAEYHGVYSRETDHLAEVAPEAAAELTRWLGERLGRKLLVPDLADAGLRFAGGRMLVSGDQPVAQFFYRRDKGLPIAVCMARIDGADTNVRLRRDGALQLAHWRRNGLEYVVVGEMGADAARAIADRVAAQVPI